MSITGAHLADLGPFFALDDTAGDDTWNPLRALLDDAEILDERVRFTQGFLSEVAQADVELRVAASTMSLGLFARLLAPQIGATALGITVPALDLDATSWRPTASGPWPIIMSGPAVVPNLETALTTVMSPLAEAIGRRYALSMTVLDGNIASAVFGAGAMLAYTGSEFAPAAFDVGRKLLAGPLSGAGTLHEEPTEEFVRTSCCLYYRVPGGGYCADCILAER